MLVFRVDKNEWIAKYRKVQELLEESKETEAYNALIQLGNFLDDHSQGWRSKSHQFGAIKGEY